MAEDDGEQKAIDSTPPVFISYASQDAAVAAALVEALERHAISCWIAPRDVKAGALYADAIVRAISRAKAFVLVLSESAIASSHVSKEIERASSKKRPIIALRIDAAPLTPALEYFLSESQWVEAQGGNLAAAYVKLIDAIREPVRAVPESLVAMTPRTSAGAASAAYPKSRRTRLLLAAGLTVLAVALVSLLANEFLVSERASQERPVDTTSAAPAAGAEARPTVSDKSVAVLPFLDMSEKHDQEYFADGMAEEIIDLLAKVRDLRVPARTSSFYFKGKSTKIPDIARELGVAHVLEGSIRRSGNKVRVSAQLVRADNGFHLWSETYDRDLRDVFKVQDEIASSVVQALQITLMGGPLVRRSGGTQNLEAYQLYLRGLSTMLQNTRPSLTAAHDYLEHAIKLDPAFGLAWAELARDMLFLTADGVLPPKEGYERARQLAQQALRVSPDLAEAHAMLQNVYRHDWDWAASEAEERQALALDPTDPTALMFAGQLSYTLGRWEDAERQLRLALVRDPLFTIAIWSLGTAQYNAGRFAAADATYRRLLELAPGFLWARTALGKTLLAEGKPEAALAMVQQEDDEENRLQFLPIALQAVERKADADEALKALIAKFAHTDAYWVAMTYAYWGDHDLALQWLEQAYTQKDIDLVEIVGEPLFRNLASDPRYKAFLRKMNLPE